MPVTQSEVQSLTLRSGVKMPIVGLGTWKIPREVTADTVLAAIKMGYRHLDCACDYGNEVEVGEGIRRALAEGAIADRSDLWITSKLWNTYHAKEHVPLALARTLADLGLAYVDLYLVHFPIALRFVPFEERYPPEWVFDPALPGGGKMEYSGVPMEETWRAMVALKAAGGVREVGVCNVTTSGLRDMLSYPDCEAPAVNQVERHLYLQQPQLRRMCEESGVAVVGFSPLGSGSYVQLGMATDADSPLLEPAVAAAAAAHGVTPGQVLLRWGVQTGCGVIPKSSHPGRLAENLDLFGFELSAEEMAALAALDKRRRFNDPGVFTQLMNSFCPIFD